MRRTRKRPVSSSGVLDFVSEASLIVASVNCTSGGARHWSEARR